MQLSNTTFQGLGNFAVSRGAAYQCRRYLLVGSGGEGIVGEEVANQLLQRFLQMNCRSRAGLFLRSSE